MFSRYGSPRYYEDVFNGIEFFDVSGSFNLLEKFKKNRLEQYEMARQFFIKLLGQYKISWQPTVGKDRDIDISRIYCEDQNEFIALMRVKPKGVRQERRVPPGVEISFHLLLGKITFKRDKRSRIMTRGNYTTIGPRNTYSLSSLQDNQTSYLVFRISQSNNPQPLPITMDGQ